jgi:hypothetical protein
MQYRTSRSTVVHRRSSCWRRFGFSRRKASWFSNPFSSVRVSKTFQAQEADSLEGVCW